MAKRKTVAALPASRKATARRNAAAGNGNDRPILKLPLEGKIKRADIRKAVQAVFREKAKARASS